MGLISKIRMLAVAGFLATGSSCALPPTMMPAPIVAGPVHVPIANQEVVWERAVDVLHDFQFEVARENKFDNYIETQYKVGASFLEPWHRDSVGFDNRAESTFQSIRRKLIVRIIPADGGHLVQVEAFKEIEDVQGVVANTTGGATFQESAPLRRDLNLVVGQSRPSGWVPHGRDPELERAVIARLSSAYSR
ncbi:MAG: hypothetical protein AB7O26_14555 [Planctomycetaceae bacterium]